MTISSESRQAGPYIGDGVADDFPFAFKVFAAADLLVIRRSTSGVESTLTLTTDYTVALNGNQNSNPGGTVTLGGALGINERLTITSQIAAMQPTDLTNNGGFYPGVITTALDRLTILVQQLAGGLSRTLKAPISDGAAASLTLPPISTRASTVLGFDALGSVKAYLPASAVTDADSVAYLPAGAGAVSRTVRAKLRETVSLEDFGGSLSSTNNQAACEAAHAYCVARGATLRISAGHWRGIKFEKYQGISIVGEGIENTYLQGFAGEDILRCVDPTLETGGAMLVPPVGTTLQGFTLLVDDTIAPPVGPGTAFDRPVYPIKSDWIAGGTYVLWDFAAYAGKVYQCVGQMVLQPDGVHISTAGVTPPTHDAGVVSDGSLYWQYIAPSQLYVGNCGFAAPVSDGASAYATEMFLNWTIGFRVWSLTNYLSGFPFEEVPYLTGGSQVAGGIYTQRAFYSAYFSEKTIVKFTCFGLVHVPASSSWSNQVFSADKTVFSAPALQCRWPFIWFNGQFVSGAGPAIYAGQIGDRGAQILQSRSLASPLASWSLSALYCEPLGSNALQLHVIEGTNMRITGGAICSSSGDNLVVSVIGKNMRLSSGEWRNGITQIFGDSIIIDNMHVTENSNVSIIQGRGSYFAFSHYTGYPLQSDRAIVSSGIARPMLGQIDGAAADGYLNSNNQGWRSWSDLLLGGRELAVSVDATFTVDPTRYSGGYVTVSAPGDAPAVNNRPLIVGVRWPVAAGQVSVCFLSSATQNVTFSLYDSTAATTLASVVYAATSNAWHTAKFDLPTLTVGHQLIFTFNFGAGQLSIDCIGFQPMRRNLITALQSFPDPSGVEGQYCRISTDTGGVCVVYANGTKKYLATYP